MENRRRHRATSVKIRSSTRRHLPYYGQETFEKTDKFIVSIRAKL